MRRIFLTVLSILVAGLAPGRPVLAQETAHTPFLGDSTLVDRVVAVVGDSVILASQVVEEAQAAQAQGQQIDPRQVLDELVNVQLVLQAAARDTTMVVDEGELEERVDQAVQEVQSRFGSPAAFRRALEQRGITAAQHRAELRERIRADQIRQMYLQRALQDAPPVSVTDAEMRQFFEERRESLQERPELLTVQQAFVEPGASDSAWAQAEAEADSIRAALVDGADFEEMAREHSEDPGSADEGGDLGWFRHGVMVREFEQAAFRLRPGEISPPVRSPFGYHIIRVDRTRPGEVKARHILIRPELSPQDESRAESRAQEIARRARSGEPLHELSEELGDAQDEAEDFTISRTEAGNIPYPGYGEALAGAGEGDVVGPFRSQIGSSTYYVVLEVTDVREAGEFTYEDVRDQIRQTLLQQKRVERIFQRLRDRTFVDVRM